jgi:hypothetical protein
MLRMSEMNDSNDIKDPGTMMYNCNPSTQKTEIGQFQIQGQSGLHREILSPAKGKTGKGCRKYSCHATKGN